MSSIRIWALGLALTASTALTTPALAQTIPASTTMTASAVADDPTLPRSILVRDDPDQVKRFPRAATPGREQDRYVMTIEEWNQRYPQDGLATYRSIATNNDGFCSYTGHIVLRAGELSQRFRAHDRRFVELGERVDHLKSSRVAGSWLRRLGEVLGIGAAASISGGYAAVVAGPMLGSEAASTANDRSQDVNRDLMRANIDLTRDNIESNLLTLDMDMFWAEEVAGWCGKNHPNAGIR
jgi:hypothetical protein